jgi:hypothetical protein
MRYRFSLFLLLVLLFSLFGCSGGNNSPVTPSGQSENEYTIETLRNLQVDQTQPENYWAAPIAIDGKIWASNHNENGTIHRAIGPGVQVGDPLEFIKTHNDIFNINPEDLVVLKDEIHDGIRYLIYQQTYKGILVARSRVDFRFSRNGKLVMLGSDVFPNLDVSTNPSLNEYSAYQVVLNDINKETAPELSESRLVIYPFPETGTLAWRIDTGDWRFYIDASSGAILERIHNAWNAYTAHVDSGAKMVSPYDTEIWVPGSYTMIAYKGSSGMFGTYGYGFGNINGDSVFVGTHSSCWAVCSFLSPYLAVSKGWFQGSSKIEGTVNDGDQTNYAWSDSNSLLSERNVFYHANKAHDYIKDIDKTFTGLDFKVAGNVNGSPMCNAMATANSINFYQPADGCNDTGHIADVIVHEYAHVFTFNQYTQDVPTDVHEGCSDYFAATYTDQSWIGRDIQGPGTKFRDCENTRQWPAPECGGEGHCVGEVLAGAFWDTREILGRSYTDYLFVYSRYGEPLTIPDFPPELIILDDDNDNPLDGSANYNVIKTTFYTNHAIPVPDAPQLPTTGVHVDVWPSDPPVKIDRTVGGNVLFKVRLTNLDSTAKYFHAWAALEVPWYGWYGPLIPPTINIKPPLYLSLGGGQTVTVTLRQAIPANLPAASYKYHVRIGTFVNHTNDILLDDGWFDVVLE